MKKTLIALFSALVIGGGVFAQNHTFGLDIAFGLPIATTTLQEEFLGKTLKMKMFDVGFSLRLQTYDCFALNNMLGIYASAGMNIGGVAIGEGDSAFDGEIYFWISGEFMIGPAFGVDLGRTRFQIGLPFHTLVANESYFGSSEIGDNIIKYNSFGFALTPQFRFSADKKCSFILGCDFTFDFLKKIKYEFYESGNKIGDETEEFDKGFRFGARPYIGVGFNF